MTNQKPDLPENPAIDIPVDSPIRIIAENGEISVVCYQNISGMDNALSMKLRFSADASGALASGLHKLVSEGHVALVPAGKRHMQ